MKKQTFLTKIWVGFVLGILLAGWGLAPVCALAQFDFNPNFIISDEQLENYNTMSLEMIQSFLEKRPGVLKTYTTGDIDGRIKTAAEIIYRVSQENKINPQVILVLLQKEQSLIENPNPSQYNLDWACGYHRPDGSDPNDPALQKYKGFTEQVDGAAGTLRWYIDHYPTPWLRLIGVPYDFDGYQVTPQNIATTALYNYTPHYNGNLNFRKKWEDYFLTTHPDGTLLSATGENSIWLIQNGQRRPFLSRAAFISRFRAENVIEVSPADLEKYPQGSAIRFAQYSLVRAPNTIDVYNVPSAFDVASRGTSGAGVATTVTSADSTVYMIDGDYKRPIDSDTTFKAIGFNPDEVTDVASADLNDYKLGNPITADSVYPTGALIQSSKTGGVYFVEAGVKQPIIDYSLLKIIFGQRKIIKATPEKLATYITAEPVRLDDGALVKAIESPAVYVIANGLKRPITSGEVFENLGYKWENIVKIPQKVLDKIHPTGDLLTLNY